jgi:hypothetical protein
MHCTIFNNQIPSSCYITNNAIRSSGARVLIATRQRAGHVALAPHAAERNGRSPFAEAQDGIPHVLPPRRGAGARAAPALFFPPRPHARRRRGAPSTRLSLFRSTVVRGPRRASARPPARCGGAAVPGRGGDVVVDAAGARAEVGGTVGGHPHAGTVPHPPAQGH